MNNLKERLDFEVNSRNTIDELSYERPDPIMVAKRYNDEFISLVCALFAYGNASQIVKFLDSLDFSLLDESEDKIKKALSSHYYRFQTSVDVVEFFLTLRRLKQDSSLEEIFFSGYKDEESVISGVNALLRKIHSLNPHSSHGYDFLIAKETTKFKGSSALKRWMMYLRWMVRDDNIDMGLWKSVNKKDLLLPLDTHTFKVSQKLGLLERKTYDLYSAMLVTDKLREFDVSDPIKYDFALYRLGQEKMI